MDPYVNFDDEGSIIGVKANAPFPQQPPAQPAQPELSPEERQAKFQESWDKNPVDVIMGLAYLVAQNAMSTVDARLKPLEDKYSDEQLEAMVDKVAEETEDVEFFTQYEEQIATEIKKVPVAIRRSNPELAVTQAYLQVKSGVLKSVTQTTPAKAPAKKPAPTPERPGTGKPLPAKPGDKVFSGMKDASESQGAFF